MKKYYIIVQLIIILVAFALIGKNVIPTKVDIEYLQVVEIIGLDETEDGVKISVFLKEQGESSKGGEQGSSDSGSKDSKVLTVESTTYSQAIDIVRNITEKYIVINHAKYFVVGESTARESLENVVDFLARTDDIMITSNVLVAEQMTAEEFLNKVNKAGTDIVKNLEEAALDVNAKNMTTDTSVMDLVDMFLQDEIVGVIPYVSVIGNDIEQFGIKYLDSEDKNTEIFGYKTIGLIRDMKVVDSITKKQVEAYNIVIGNVDNLVILIRPSENEKVVINCNTKEHKVYFKTNDDNISKMVVELKYECDLDEVQSNKELFTLERFELFQQMVEEVVEKQIKDIISKELEQNLDFIGLGEMFYRQHPYIYLEIKENFLEKLKLAKIEVKVDCTVNHTYDVMQTNKYQKGDDNG